MTRIGMHGVIALSVFRQPDYIKISVLDNLGVIDEMVLFGIDPKKPIRMGESDDRVPLGASAFDHIKDSRAILAELVACKRLATAIGEHLEKTHPEANEEAEFVAMMADYDKRKPLAWAAAFDLIGEPS